MKKSMMAALVIALTAGAGGAQEADRQQQAKAELEAKQKEAVGVATKAVTDTAARGGVHLKGSVRFGLADGAMVMGLGGMGRKLEGDLTARIGRSGVLAATVEGDAGRLEVYRKGDRTTHRMTWAGGKPPSPGDVSRELGRVLDWKVLTRFAPKLRDAKLEAADGAKIVSGRLSEDFLPAEASDVDGEGEGMCFEAEMMVIDRIEASFHVGADGILKKVTVKVVRKLNPAVVMGAGGAGGDDEEDDEEAPGGMNFKTESTYEVQIDRFEPEMDIEIPGELKKFLQ